MRYLATALWCAASLTAGAVTPAERAIEKAQAFVAREAERFEHRNALALAYARRARETADHVWYERAAEAIGKSLELSPDNFEARKVQCWVLLGHHRFAEALHAAKELRKRSGDDEMVYGLLTDAYVELGQYAEAEDAAQWMLNIGRSSVPGLTRAAFLRELFGDVEGSVDLMKQALQRTDPAETEDRAWILTHIGHLLAVAGRTEEAGQALNEALRIMPDYHYALAGLARVHAAGGRREQAVAVLQRRYRIAPHPENLFHLAAALHAAGKGPEAQAAFLEFERDALAESENEDNANRELVAYYADYAHNAPEALRIASMEIRRRQDIFTLDAWAWALHRNGRGAEALTQIEKALGVGTVDPRLLFHAGAIADAAGKRDVAVKYLQKCLDTNSRSEVAAEARRLLVRLSASALVEHW